jgi:hypothetical protein
MPESRWKPGGVTGRPRGWLLGRPSPPNRLNQVGGSSPRPLYKVPHGRTHTLSQPVFKAKTKCIPLCVPGSSFTHKATNSGINSITSAYYIVSYYKNFLQVQEGLSSG